MKKIDPASRYFETNEWVKLEKPNLAIIGITDFAQTVIGNIVNIHFPEMGKIIQKGDPLLEIESGKVNNEVFSPISGKIILQNKKLENHLNWVNESPYEQGWLLKMEINDLQEWETLMTATEYRDYMKVFYNKI